MAQFSFDSASLKVFFETGVDKEGQPIIKAKTFQNVRESATADQIQAVAQAINSLSSFPVLKAQVVRTDTILF